MMLDPIHNILTVCCLSCLYFSWCLEASLLLSHRKPLSIHKQPPSSLSTTECGTCNLRMCPRIDPDSCHGNVVKDNCGCCPLCEHGGVKRPPMVEMADLESQRASTKNNSCAHIECPRTEICVNNIQGLPTCRCPSAFWCRRLGRKRPLCGENGRTYRSRCFLKVAECELGQRIRITRKGFCSGKNRVQKLHNGDSNVDEKALRAPKLAQKRNDKPVSPVANHRNRKNQAHKIPSKTKQQSKLTRQKSKKHPLQSARKNSAKRMQYNARKSIPSLASNERKSTTRRQGAFPNRGRNKAGSTTIVRNVLGKSKFSTKNQNSMENIRKNKSDKHFNRNEKDSRRKRKRRQRKRKQKRNHQRKFRQVNNS